MTHTASFQSKPSLSVRTRALTNKYHIRFVNKYNLLRNSSNLRLRHRITSRGTLNFMDQPGVSKQNNCYGQILRNEPPASISDNNFTSLNDPNNTTTAFPCIPDTYTSSSASSTSSVSNNQISVCKWDECDTVEVKESQLVNHIYQMHVIPQFLLNRRKYFCCLWRDCRVFGCPSVSFSWLENHILHHTDAKGKPFVCIFDYCNIRFSTSLLLERHIQRTHMRSNNTTGLAYPLSLARSPFAFNSSKQLEPSTPTKRNIKRRKKTRPYTVRRTDFYDTRSQTVVQNRLKISYLINEFTRTVGRSFEFSDQIFENLHGLPVKMHATFTNKLRLRSYSNDQNSNNLNSNLKDLLKSDSPNDLHNRILLLLTTPYTFVGQRLSEDDRCEFLVRWTSEVEKRELTPMWISEGELQIAEHFEKFL